jgi:hypothetical protein
MHESREKRSLSLLRSGRVRRRARSRSRSAVFAAPICADYEFTANETQNTGPAYIRIHTNTFKSRSFTTHQHNSQLSPRQSRGSSWGPPAYRVIIRIQIHETTGQT